MLRWDVFRQARSGWEPASVAQLGACLALPHALRALDADNVGRRDGDVFSSYPLDEDALLYIADRERPGAPETQVFLYVVQPVGRGVPSVLADWRSDGTLYCSSTCAGEDDCGEAGGPIPAGDFRVERDGRCCPVCADDFYWSRYGI